MAVITNEGLIGETVKVAHTTCTVRLITSREINNKVSVKINSESGPVFGILSSFNQDSKNLVITGIDSHENIKTGNTVTTSGLGGKYPAGILIGTVNKMDTDEYGLAKIVEVKPSADLNDIKFVTILKRNKE